MRPESEDGLVSVVTPVYRTAESIEELHRRLVDVLSALRRPFELVFVDDASPDHAGKVLRRLAGADGRVRVLALTRNEGQHRAVLRGLAAVRGDPVIVLDSDLQDAPEAIPALFAAADSGVAAVFAGRRGSYQSAGRLRTSRLFKRVNRLLCGVPVDAGLFVLLRRPLVERLLELSGPPPHVVSMIGLSGLRMRSIPIERVERPSGSSAYVAHQRIAAAMRALGWGFLWRWSLLRRAWR
jgi:glycosyltransferase involved in cell wall biosynthesis